MAAVSQPGRDRPAPWFRTGLVGVAAVVTVVAIGVLIGSAVRSTGSPTRGSGVSVTDYRQLAPFSTVELGGANTVLIRVGPDQSVAVTADDNLVHHVTTTVRGGTLVIANSGAFTTNTPMTVAVSAPSLDAVTLSGSGTVTVDGVRATRFAATLSGTGTVTASGTAERLTAVLGGSGTMQLGDLTGQDVTARLDGTGTMNVRATATLDASLTGVGSIVYSGSPSITTHNAGTGSITSS